MPQDSGVDVSKEETFGEMMGGFMMGGGKICGEFFKDVGEDRKDKAISAALETSFWRFLKILLDLNVLLFPSGDFEIEEELIRGGGIDVDDEQNDNIGEGGDTFVNDDGEVVDFSIV